MAIRPKLAGRIIFTGVYKVMNQVTPRWATLRDQPVKTFFDGVANPTSWPRFFVDAVATSIQQELILHNSYCPGLEDELKSLHDNNKPWKDLEQFVKNRVRTVQTRF